MRLTIYQLSITILAIRIESMALAKENVYRKDQKQKVRILILDGLAELVLDIFRGRGVLLMCFEKKVTCWEK